MCSATVRRRSRVRGASWIRRAGQSPFERIAAQSIVGTPTGTSCVSRTSAGPVPARSTSRSVTASCGHQERPGRAVILVGRNGAAECHPGRPVPVPSVAARQMPDAVGDLSQVGLGINRQLVEVVVPVVVAVYPTQSHVATAEPFRDPLEEQDAVLPGPQPEVTELKDQLGVVDGLVCGSTHGSEFAMRVPEQRDESGRTASGIERMSHTSSEPGVGERFQSVGCPEEFTSVPGPKTVSGPCSDCELTGNLPPGSHGSDPDWTKIIPMSATIHDVLEDLRESATSEAGNGSKFERLVKAVLQKAPVFAGQSSDQMRRPTRSGSRSRARASTTGTVRSSPLTTAP